MNLTPLPGSSPPAVSQVSASLLPTPSYMFWPLVPPNLTDHFNGQHCSPGFIFSSLSERERIWNGYMLPASMGCSQCNLPQHCSGMHHFPAHFLLPFDESSDSTPGHWEPLVLFSSCAFLTPSSLGSLTQLFLSPRVLLPCLTLSRHGSKSASSWTPPDSRNRKWYLLLNFCKSYSGFKC